MRFECSAGVLFYEGPSRSCPLIAQPATLPGRKRSVHDLLDMAGAKKDCLPLLIELNYVKNHKFYLPPTCFQFVSIRPVKQQAGTACPSASRGYPMQQKRIPEHNPLPCLFRRHLEKEFQEIPSEQLPQLRLDLVVGCSLRAFRSP